MGKRSKIRMQESRLKISGGRSSDSGLESRNGEVSRADKTT
jgi:hypothetical protein